MSWRGYINKRHTPVSPPSMTKVYAVLWGTMWLDYENEEAAKSSLAPILASEVLGVSEWDGQGRANQYPNGFLIVTHTGQEYYLSAANEEERQACILQVRVGLECHFANSEVNPYKPSKHIQQRPAVVGNIICPKTKTAMGTLLPDSHLYSSSSSGAAGISSKAPSKEADALARRRYLDAVQAGQVTANPPFASPTAQLCLCCGRGYSTAAHVAAVGPPVVQLGCEAAEIMCEYCIAAQSAILWLKTLNYAHVGSLHEMTPDVTAKPDRFKATFALFRKKSQRLDMAAALWEGEDITPEEFHELRQVDEDYRREVVLEEAEKLKLAVDALGDDIQTILSLLMNPAATAAGGPIAYHYVVLKLLSIADTEPLLIDFYWPQFIHVHLQVAGSHSFEYLAKVDEIQQVLLVLAHKYPQLGTKLAWALMSTLSDYTDRDASNGRISAAQYAACLCLLLQLEHILTGDMSTIYNALTAAAVDGCPSLASVLSCADHQKQELVYEISVLFLTRRRLQESYDREVKSRVCRKGLLDGATLSPAVRRYSLGKTNLAAAAQEATTEKEPVLTLPTKSSSPPKEDGGATAAGAVSCVTLLNQLGVGADVKDAKEKEVKENGAVEAVAANWEGLATQLNFMDRLTTLVDSLRFIERPLRSAHLCSALVKWNKEGQSAATSSSATDTPAVAFAGVPTLGWDPTGAAGEPLYRITRILPEYCRVFRTKARAPSLIVCEVMREDVHQHLTRPDRGTGSSHVKERSNSVTIRDLAAAKTLASTLTSPNKLVLTASPTDKSAEKQSHNSTSSSGNRNRTRSYELASHLHTHTFNTSDSGSHADLHDLIGKEIMTSDDSPDVPSAADMQDVVGDLVDSSIGNIVEAIGKIQLQQVAEEEKEEQEPAIPASSDTTTNQNKLSVPRTNQFAAKRRLSGNLLSKNRISDGNSFQALLSKASSDDLQLHSVNSPTNPNRQSMGFSSFESPMVSPGGRTPRNSIVGEWEKYSESSGDELTEDDGDDDDAKSDNAAVTGGTDKSAMTGERRPSSLTLAIPSVTDVHTHTHTPIPLFPASPRPGNAPLITGDRVLTSAQRLLLAGKIDEEEYGLLLQSDSLYQEEEARVREEEIQAKVESVFGPSWETIRERELQKWDPNYDPTASNSDEVTPNNELDDNVGMPLTPGGNAGDNMPPPPPPNETRESTTHTPELTSLADENKPVVAHMPDVYLDPELDENWPPVDLRCYIVKSNDDLRQEMAVLQLMCLCKEIFVHVGLTDQQLFLHPYRIVGTGCSTGVVEVLTDTLSLDALKKTPGFTSLNQHFYNMYATKEEMRELEQCVLDGTMPSTEVGGTTRLAQAKQAFTASLAAYSVFTYIFAIKDRHNGNVLLDHSGHILHIDFGFLLGGAPGGAFSMEAAPFKLTEEMVRVMDGLESPLFGEFIKSFTTGFLALRSNSETIISALEVLSINSPFVCFAGKDRASIIEKLRSRFRHDLDTKAVVQHCIDLTVSSYAHFGTRQYDNFQWYTNGIAI